MELSDRQILLEIKSKPGINRNNELETILWKRYQRLIDKNWNILKKQMNHSSLILSEEDEFYSEAYVAFRKCIEAINVDKIDNDNWKFLGYYRLYLKNVRTTLIKRVVLKAKKEKCIEYKIDDRGDVLLSDFMVAHSDLFVVNDDPSDLLVQKESLDTYNAAINKCKENWSGTKREIYDRKLEGDSNSDIARSLKVHPATITYYIKLMRKDVLAEIGTY